MVDTKENSRYIYRNEKMFFLNTFFSEDRNSLSKAFTVGVEVVTISFSGLSDRGPMLLYANVLATPSQC